MKNLLTVKELSSLLRVSSQTLYKMLEQGDIPAVKIGAQWRFDPEKIQLWLETNASEPRESVSPGTK